MTELERHLLSAFDHFESDYSMRESALRNALSNMEETLNVALNELATSLSLRLNDTTKRLELMTASYSGLLRHIDDLSSQLAELQRLLTT